MHTTYQINPDLAPPVDVIRSRIHAAASVTVCRHTLAEAVANAQRSGLRELTLVGRVRAHTHWVPSFVSAVEELRHQTRLRLRCAVEARLLDMSGGLDLPGNLTGVESIYVSDDHIPMPDGVSSPLEIRALIKAGKLNPRVAIVALVIATAMALHRPEPTVIARPFRALREMGLSDDDVPLELVEALVSVAVATGAWLEIDDVARCAGRGTLRPFLEGGVPFQFSTSIYRFEAFGQSDRPAVDR